MKRLLFDRFREKYVEDESGCWLWTASTDSHGYGKIWLDGRLVGAHRVAYELTVGPIPNGLNLDHLCRTPRCVNPDHLEPVTQQTNVARARGSECPAGHPFSATNTYRRPSRNGRECRICRTENGRARRMRCPIGRPGGDR